MLIINMAWPLSDPTPKEVRVMLMPSIIAENKRCAQAGSSRTENAIVKSGMWKLVSHTDSQMSVCYAVIAAYGAVFG